MGKYHIETKQVPPRFLPPGPYCVIAKEEGCLGCKYCVKKACPYGVYEKKGFDIKELRETSSYYCHHCLFCVESCPAGLISLMPNPEYQRLGDGYWTPEIITSLWRQAETGKIPVSGAGYGGPFVGEGFDEMWTDMSEIVRPTRDGIHGREYISTAVELGRKPLALEFDPDKKMVSQIPPFVEISLPVLLSLPSWGRWDRNVLFSLAKAAAKLNTLFIMPLKEFDSTFLSFIDHLMLSVETKEAIRSIPAQAQFIEIPLDLVSEIDVVRQGHSERIISVKVPFGPGVEKTCLDLVQNGVPIIHLFADEHGREMVELRPRFIKDAIQDVHFSLVEQGVRDQVTLLASGGIAMAEHMGKTIICGADAVVVGQALMVALECRLCKECEKGLPCPVEINAIDSEWGAQRIINLMGSWHSQLLEVMGAMGMRDVRRLRGELGRAIFYRDVIKESFANIKKVSGE